MDSSEVDLEHQHHPQAIHERVNAGRGQGHLSDAVLGAMDGSISTFTIVAGAVGGGLTGDVIVILGVAKVAADAFSMAASNYLSRRSEQQEIERARSMEQRHVELHPEGEREELRHIFRSKGFRGALLEEIVRVLTRHPEAWIETMIKEEHHLPPASPHPLRAAVATFLAFMIVGIIPLTPFLLPEVVPAGGFVVSAAITALIFVLIGVVRGRILERSLWRGGLETLAVGGVAAGVAYAIGAWLRQLQL